MASSTFRLGSFTKSLLAQAQTDESGLSPGTLGNLVNPMRSQLGLPCLSLFKMEAPEGSSGSIYSGQESPPVVGQQLDTVKVKQDRNDSGVDSSNSDTIQREGAEAHERLLNSSFSATDELNAFRRLAMNDSSDASTIIEGSRTENIDTHNQGTCVAHSTTSSHPYQPPASINRTRTKPLAQTAPFPQFHPQRGNALIRPLRFEDEDVAENRDQSTELPRFTQSNLHKGPLSKCSLPTPNKTGGLSGALLESNSVAAVIPTPKPKSKYPSGDNNRSAKKSLTTPKSNVAPAGQLMKQRSLPSLKEKKPVATVGWKFSSEQVQGKEYLIIKQLGKGGCGEVLLVIEKESRELFALKRVNLSGIADASVEECVNEVQMLVDLRDSDLVVHIYAWEFDKKEKTMKILMEHGQCDLQHSIKAKNWTSLKLRSIWERLLTIVDVIHNRGIVHADLKPANFIWSGDNLKIIDFGIASRLQSDHTSIAMLCPKGTLNFISPETIQPNSKISPKSDIWSLGCILYLMVYGKTPFEHIGHPVQKMTAIVTGTVDYPSIPLLLSSSATEILSTLKLCFQMDYRRRPSTSDLLRHPLIKNI